MDQNIFIMNGVVALKRERENKCDALQAMVGSLKLQLSLYAQIMNERHEEEKRRKRKK